MGGCRDGPTASSGAPVTQTVHVNAADHIFTSTARGTPADNPTDPQSLTVEQASRGVTFFFRPQDGVVDAIERVTDRYLAERTDGERFVDTYRRIGMEPFKEAIYG